MKVTGTKQLSTEDMEYLRLIRDPLILRLMQCKVFIQHDYEYDSNEPAALISWLRENIKSSYFVEERTSNYHTLIRFSEEAESLLCVMRWNKVEEVEDE